MVVLAEMDRPFTIREWTGGELLHLPSQSRMVGVVVSLDYFSHCIFSLIRQLSAVIMTLVTVASRFSCGPSLLSLNDSSLFSRMH